MEKSLFRTIDSGKNYLNYWEKVNCYQNAKNYIYSNNINEFNFYIRNTLEFNIRYFNFISNKYKENTFLIIDIDNCYINLFLIDEEKDNNIPNIYFFCFDIKDINFFTDPFKKYIIDYTRNYNLLQ